MKEEKKEGILNYLFSGVSEELIALLEKEKNWLNYYWIKGREEYLNEIIENCKYVLNAKKEIIEINNELWEDTFYWDYNKKDVFCDINITKQLLLYWKTHFNLIIKRTELTTFEYELDRLIFNIVKNNSMHWKWTIKLLIESIKGRRDEYKRVHQYLY